MNYKGAIDLESEIKMNISYKDYNITLLGTVKSQHAFEGERGLGIRFKFQNIWENLYMRKIVKQVSKDIAMIEKAQKKAQKMAA